MREFLRNSRLGKLKTVEKRIGTFREISYKRVWGWFDDE